MNNARVDLEIGGRLTAAQIMKVAMELTDAGFGGVLEELNTAFQEGRTARFVGFVDQQKAVVPVRTLHAIPDAEYKVVTPKKGRTTEVINRTKATDGKMVVLAGDPHGMPFEGLLFHTDDMSDLRQVAKLVNQARTPVPALESAEPSFVVVGERAPAMAMH